MLRQVAAEMVEHHEVAPPMFAPSGPPPADVVAKMAVAKGGKFAATVLGFANRLDATGGLGGETLSEAKKKHEQEQRQKRATSMASAAAKQPMQSGKFELSAKQMRGMAAHGADHGHRHVAHLDQQ